MLYIDMRFQIMCGKSQGDVEVLIAKDGLFVAEYRICELGLEGLGWFK